MVFNSIHYLLFLVAAAAICSLLRPAHRNMFLLAASYFFYMSLGPAYALLLLDVTIVCYTVGIMIGDIRKHKKSILSACITLLLMQFVFFKYYNFLADSIGRMLLRSGVNIDIPVFNFLLPAGISFFTLQGISYCVDVYKGRITPEKDPVSFALYMAFFPKLVAGPIERAGKLIPQFSEPGGFDSDRIWRGLVLILWGLFKKMVIADRLAVYVASAFGSYAELGSGALLLATYCFTYQIYCDFSGYTDIARGSAKLLGFDLMENFRNPYYADCPQEFWRRWHISLSTWFRDYLYIPLGGNKTGKLFWTFNIMLVFVLSGLWHGANWTFIAWGAVHGVFFVIFHFLGFKPQKYNGHVDMSHFFSHAARVFVTFNITAFAWVFFRAPNMTTALGIFQKITVPALNINFIMAEMGPRNIALIFVAVSIAEFVGIRKGFRDLPDWLSGLPTASRWLFYIIVSFLLLKCGAYNEVKFIYSQF